MESHALLRQFKANEPAFGVWLTSGGFFHARTLAQASSRISWVMIDCEHGLVGLNPGAAELIAGIHGVQNGPSALVRIAATGMSTGVNWQIKYALDAGARGVLVPMVNTLEQAKAVAADGKYPPVGRRGHGGAYTHGNWGVTRPEYFKAANENVLVIVQIETVEGVRNMKEIAAVDGIDGLFVGPSDLSITLGFPPPSPDPHPEVEKVIQSILEVAHEAGKKCAIYCSNGKQAARRAVQGFDMINVTSDVSALSEGIITNVATAEAPIKEGVGSK
ncbi:Phosphoenolpyruvate/pyruvate domain-containing protein [Marasmius fiardii PR-910]|nr:Phosphoenolpyruvate/pyruvate domain-containing protein [Marasmius fiardii PR-910]